MGKILAGERVGGPVDRAGGAGGLRIVPTLPAVGLVRGAGPGVERGPAAGRTGPGLGLERIERIDEVGFLVAPGPAPPCVGVDLVDAALDPADSAPSHLVAHGIGERLGRGLAVDRVPVVVEQDVQRPEREAPVGAEDRPAARSERASPQLDGIGVGGWHGQLVGVGRLTPVAVRPAWPEGLPGVVEAVDDLDAACGQHLELPIGVGELHPELVTVGLEAEASLVRDLRDPPEGLPPGQARLLSPLGCCGGGSGWCWRRFVAVHGWPRRSSGDCAMEGRALEGGREPAKGSIIS